MSNFNFFKKFNAPSNKPSRNGFDLSRNESYSLPFGTIVPVSFDFLQPNDFVKGKVASYVQTNNMRDDNFSSIYNHMKAVFVPMSSLKRNFVQFTPDVDTDRLRKDEGISQDYYIPSLNLKDFHQMYFPWFLLNYLVQQAISVTPEIINYNFVCANHAFSSIRDEYGNTVSVSAQSNPCGHFLARILLPVAVDSVKYNPILDIYFLLSRLKNDSSQFFVFDALRLLDSLGYGNYWPIYSDLANKFISDIISGNVQPTNYFGLSYDSSNDIEDITLNQTNFASYFAANCTPLVESNVINLEKLAAYQFYIQSCERDNFRDPDTFVFTLDYFARMIQMNQISGYNQTVAGSSGHQYSIQPAAASISIYKKFTTLSPYMVWQFGSYPIPYAVILNYLFSLHNPLMSRDLFTGSSQYDTPASQGSQQALSIENLNSVDAAYKAKLALLRAGVKVSDYMKAFFGVKGDNDIVQPVLMLDDTRNAVKINGIFNMAETEVAELGARGARGNGGAGLQFSLQANDYGYLFYIQYLTCDTYYENFMISRDSQLIPEYLPTPFTANLGLSHISQKDVSFMKKRGSQWQTAATLLQGFSAHDWFLKTKLNLAHGFFTNVPLTYTGTNYSNIESIAKLPTLSRGNAARGGFVPTLFEEQFDGMDMREDMYFSPTLLNGIFTQMNDGTIYAAAQFDPFTIVTRFSIYKVSSMSNVGLPKTL